MSEDNDVEHVEMGDVPMLPAEQVADNFRAYIGALEAEKAMSQATIDALESGTLDVDEMVEALPDPSPLELWNRDQWADRPDNYDATALALSHREERHER